MRDDRSMDENPYRAPEGEVERRDSTRFARYISGAVRFAALALFCAAIWGVLLASDFVTAPNQTPLWVTAALVLGALVLPLVVERALFRG
jgi:hypothetical protein